MESSRKYGSSASIAFAYTLELEVEAATIAIANAVSWKIFILVLLLFVSKFQMEEEMRSWCFFIFVEIERLLFVFVVVVRKKRVFEFDVCLCFVLYDMLVDFMSSFVVSQSWCWNGTKVRMILNWLILGLTKQDILLLWFPQDYNNKKTTRSILWHILLRYSHWDYLLSRIGRRSWYMKDTFSSHAMVSR